MKNIESGGERGKSVSSSGEAFLASVQSEHAWFLGRVEAARKRGMFCEWAILTPALAVALTSWHMPAGSNRRFSPVHAAKIAEVIRSGKWNGNTHQGISFAPDGLLNDGQHRIWSVQETGIAIEIPMIFGQPRETFKSIDQLQKARVAADNLDIAQLEVGDSKTAASIARIIVIIRDGVDEAPRDDIQDLAVKHENDLRYATNAGRRVAAHLKSKVSGANIGAALFLIRQQKVPEDDIEEFIAELCSAANHDDTSPSLWCREGLRSRSFGSKYRNANDRRVPEVAAVVKAWNLRRTGRKAKSASSLRLAQKEAFPRVIR